MTTPYLSCIIRRGLRTVAGTVAVLGASGCATVSNANYGRPMDVRGHLAEKPKTAAGLVVTGEEDTELATPYVGVVLVTFENPTNQWVHVKGMALGFGGGEKDANVTVPLGADLESWAAAVHQLEVIDRTNRTMALGALALAGGVTAGVARRNALGVAGAAVATGSLAALAASSVDATIHEAEAPYFDAHLLSVPFSIPPGLFTKRWVALSTTGGPRAPCIESVLLDYELGTGNRERVWLTFRKRASTSTWQRTSCMGPVDEQQQATARGYRQ
jgi:hypothetical protein